MNPCRNQNAALEIEMTPSGGGSTDLIHEARTPADSDALGAAFAAVCEPGLVVGLIGPLGAGKTAFVRAVAAGLGVPAEAVGSPTFVLIHEYEGRLPVYHFDTYRLRDADAFLDLGAAELFDADGVCLIEWADRVAEVLPADTLWVTIEVTAPESRRFHFQAAGPRSTAFVERLRKGLSNSGGTP
jgi:tRNA threonylcarbamoyladenosine biosynthesis protein TsaE